MAIAGMTAEQYDAVFQTYKAAGVWLGLALCGEAFSGTTRASVRNKILRHAEHCVCGPFIVAEED